MRIVGVFHKHRILKLYVRATSTQRAGRFIIVICVDAVLFFLFLPFSSYILFSKWRLSQMLELTLDALSFSYLHKDTIKKIVSFIREERESEAFEWQTSIIFLRPKSESESEITISGLTPANIVRHHADFIHAYIIWCWCRTELKGEEERE